MDYEQASKSKFMLPHDKSAARYNQHFLICSIKIIWVLNFYGTTKKKERVLVVACSTLTMTQFLNLIIEWYSKMLHWLGARCHCHRNFSFFHLVYLEKFNDLILGKWNFTRRVHWKNCNWRVYHCQQPLLFDC